MTTSIFPDHRNPRKTPISLRYRTRSVRNHELRRLTEVIEQPANALALSHGIRPVVGEFRKRAQFLSFFILIPSVHARPFHALSARNRHHHPAGSTRWSPFRCCRVRFDATSTSDFESRPKACSQPPAGGSGRRRFVHSTDASDSCSAVGYRLETRDSPEISQNAGQTKVPAPIFTKTIPSAGSQRADNGANRRRS